jgi:hypothetical protein
MSKIIKLTESDLTNLVKKVLAEEQTTNYMLFSNLEQIKRQCEILLEMDPNMIDEIIQDGHDWADDHVSEAKNNMDQVFDFFMNETKGDKESRVSVDMNQFSLNEDGKMESGEKDPCWKGYEMVGKKKKNGKEVPNCVPKKK